MGEASEIYEPGMSPEEQKQDARIASAIVRAVAITKSAKGKSKTIANDLSYQLVTFRCVLTKLLEEI